MGQQWEYLTEFIVADIDDTLDGRPIRDHLEHLYPNWTAPKYSPAATVPWLNERGAQGWQLVSMVPVMAIGTNHDVLFDRRENLVNRVWGHTYFCAFKRPVEPQDESA